MIVRLYPRLLAAPTTPTVSGGPRNSGLSRLPGEPARGDGRCVLAVCSSAAIEPPQPAVSTDRTPAVNRDRTERRDGSARSSVVGAPKDVYPVERAVLGQGRGLQPAPSKIGGADRTVSPTRTVRPARLLRQTVRRWVAAPVGNQFGMEQPVSRGMVDALPKRMKAHFERRVWATWSRINEDGRVERHEAVEFEECLADQRRFIDAGVSLHAVTQAMPRATDTDYVGDLVAMHQARMAVLPDAA